MEVTLYDRKLSIIEPSKIGRRRWSGLLSPEPETVRWIEDLPSGSVFFDIGANVGTHAARASLRGLQVFAFEPAPSYFAELKRLIEVNDLSIKAYQIALSDYIGNGVLSGGRSEFTFCRDGNGVMAFSTTLDAFCAANQVWPHYLKLDVDGNELEILQGADKTMDLIEGALIEIDPVAPGHDQIIPLMLSHGFSFDAEQVAADRIEGGKYDGMCNVIFWR